MSGPESSERAAGYDLEALTERMVGAPPEVQIDFLLRVVDGVTDERDLLERHNNLLLAVLSTVASCDRCDVCENRAAEAIRCVKESS